MQQNGFTYVEVLLSVVLLVVLLVPALQALQSGISGGATPTMAASAPTLRAKMEEVLAIPFSDLYAQTYLVGGNTNAINTTYSDAAGANRRVVVLYRYDATAKALSASDTGLLFVSVYYESEGSGAALNTLLGRWW